MKIIGGFLLIILGVLTMFAFFADMDSQYLIFAAGFILLGIYLLNSKNRAKEPKVRAVKDNPEETFVIPSIKHISGLPIQEEKLVSINYEVDKLVISGIGVNFTLNSDKIIEVSHKTAKEIQSTNYASSAGGAIAGGIVLGPIGALILGRTKKHVSYKNSSYLIITYAKDNEIKNLVFDSWTSGVNTLKLVKIFKNKENAQISIDL